MVILTKPSFTYAKKVRPPQPKSEREARAGLIETYVHGGRIGVIVEINCETDFVARTVEFKEFARDVAMHIAATNPEYLSLEAVPAEVVEQERSIYRKEVAGKPEQIVDKIVEGKLAKFYENSCLMQQVFIKDPDMTVTKLTSIWWQS